MTQKLISTLILSSIMLFLFVTNSNSLELESKYKDREIIIDGNVEEWDEATQYFKKKDIVVGVMNDDRYLYVCFYPTTRELSNQLSMQGFTVWFNNKGKKRENFGIKFLSRMKGMMNNRMEEPPEMHQREPEDMSSEMMKEMENNLQEKIEIIGPKKGDSTTIKLEDLVGLNIGIADVKGFCVYEIKIPYEQNQVYSATIDTEPGSKIAIGFQTNKIDMKEMPSRMGDRPGGGMPGSGHGSQGGNFGGRHEGNIKALQSLKAWFTLELAVKP